MENKKGSLQSQVASFNNLSINETIHAKPYPQTTPQNLRFIQQYGMKIPNNANQSLLPQPHHPPINLHLQQIPYQPTPNRYNQNQNNHQHYDVLRQHQQKIYQSPQPPPLHAQAQITPNTPQVWVPPVLYQQPQQSAQKQNASPPQGQSTPAKDILERKKSGTSPHLKSPIAKRPLEAPVTMQGWLHKQGSDGFMLWKKRWFVLSEYCLFYYKGPEEEKLLGSILLPSYKVSVCGSDDKVNKKYSFKCEHANMRTYILAADSQELMLQWIKVLNMACLLQSSIENDQQSSVSAPSTYLHSTPENPEPTYGHQQFRNHVNIRSTPAHTHSSSNTTDFSNPSQQELSQYSQPLYANAPPKPRRLQEGYSSPSPDALDRYGNLMNQPYLTPIKSNRSITKSPISIYGHNSPQPEYVQLVRRPAYETPGIHPQNAERRTPDTYGRSKLNRSRPTDYEDVYIDQSIYKRPLSPISSCNVRSNPVMNPAYRTYTPINMHGSKDSPLYLYPQPQMRKSPSTVPRPHSADFLEYEVQHRANNTHLQKPRPKSSLDINRNKNDCDNYFYSEANYAEKMRKSVQYLQNKMASNNRSLQQPTSSRQSDENTYPLVRSNTTSYNIPSIEISNPQPPRSRSVLSEGSIAKELEMDLRCSPRDMNRIASPAFSTPKPNHSRYEYQDQFTRSASARAPQSTDRNLEARSLPRDGDKKREESMKRLLEWKQRMLQSPLNRKSQGTRSSQSRSECIYAGNENGFGPRGYASKAMPQYNSYSSDDEASGSINISTRDNTFPRGAPPKLIWGPEPAASVANLARSPPQNYPMHPGYSQSDVNSEIYMSRKELNQLNNKVSAGELLGRTHEELVLLLIQLRRQSANTLQAIETYYNEIDTLQAQLGMMDQAKRIENLQKLEKIKQHLIELEKQYEKGKPLVNLVDNMVKLGTLYRSPSDRNQVNPYIRDRLEFNQQVQERRLLAEEQRDWNRIKPNHVQLQEKVQELYKLDKLIHEESGTLQCLQKDKEDIERALGGLRMRLNKGFNDPAEVDMARKQQIMLENELSRVHLMLAQNSKKLEETVAGNARLEQELLVLKQKLQLSRQQRSSPQLSNAGDSIPCVVGTSAMLESDLHRVQQSVGNLQKQRQELSMQVRQLTDRSLALQKVAVQNYPQAQAYLKRKMSSTVWRETDLDTMNIVDHGDNDNQLFPLYINTNLKLIQDDYYNRSLKSSDSTTSDDNQNGLLPNERQEIKTVRIVKRESERRQRDREKTVTNGTKWDALTEEDDSSQSSSILFRPTPVQKTQSSSSIISPLEDRGYLSKQSSLSSPALPQYDSPEEYTKLPEPSPVYQSEAAREIITELTNEMAKETKPTKRAVPKEKRRHYTAPNNNLIMKSLHQLPTEDNAAILNTRRARDDLDMERALRRIDTPDVVRSTLSSKELKYNESTIDNILGTPNKINIPERYIPEQLPQLSVEEQEHRLRKVESIKKMLSDTTIISSSTGNLHADENPNERPVSSFTNKATSKMIEEKKQREHLLQLNQILAKQVMEMSKIVAGTNSPEEKYIE